MILKSIPFLVFLAMASSLDSAYASNPLLVQVQVQSSTENTPGAQSKSFSQPASGADTTNLLHFVTGAQGVASGGVSALPYLNGLWGSSLNVQIDGVRVPNVCPNEMIPPTSTIPPSQVGKIEVFPTVAPVTVAGNSLGGTILVSSPAPIFAQATNPFLYGGSLSAFYHSNGDIHGENLSLFAATPHFYIQYAGSLSQGDNYQAGKGFKAATPSIPAKTVGSTAFRAENQALTLAGHWDDQELSLRIRHQHLPYEGYPNVRMDLTDNQETSFNLHYHGAYRWGFLDARLYNTLVQHEMNFLGDKMAPGSMAMPMYTQGVKSGLRIEIGQDLSNRDILRSGIDFSRYHLDDWWTPVPGNRMMSPDTFWNIRDGREYHYDLFTDWTRHWNSQWMSRVGLRYDIATLDTGPVQGYNAMMYGNPAMASSIPGRFNRADRARNFGNWDLSAILRYQATPNTRWELGFARNVQSPNLYELYAWSSNPMAMSMNGWFGDGNGYIGNLNLRAQTANILSLSLATQGTGWHVQITPYVNYVQNYIGVQRCPTQLGGACTAANIQAQSGFVYLQFTNQNALLWGVNAQGSTQLFQTHKAGSVFLDANLAYVHGENLSIDAPLYRMIPVNGSITLRQEWGHFQNWIRETLVASKTRVDPLRNELQTPGYGLLELGTRWQSGSWQASLQIENVLNQLYFQPLGGVYLGQKPFAYGIPLPGPGRSVNLDLSYQF